MYGERPFMRDGRDQRRLEPAAVLVGRFEVQVRRAVDAHHLVDDGLRSSRRSRSTRRACRCGAWCPGAGRALSAMILSSGSNQMFVPCFSTRSATLSIQSQAQERLAVRVVKHGQRHAPGALARDAPVRPRFHRAVDAVAAPGRNPLHLVDGAQRLGPQFVHADEELLHRAEDDRHLRAPAMRVGVVDRPRARERADVRAAWR